MTLRQEIEKIIEENNGYGSRHSNTVTDDILKLVREYVGAEHECLY